ncbi:hypothetical protein LH407_06615 [Antiquaquibacter oligotrophicus]|uniref:hypothetical protein n=1 Tax=Antiquaquibacter oligotrophicus TaxID=2880260 RepID=UPI002AC9E2B6|nr:hypothetical protein [Antiquaquibacter oligotrophicus]UDF14529.1 hypothetical protein LH407_06615 [Antiquaquibacter oligotrophicus]
MTITETLLIIAALVSLGATALLATVLWLQRPRHRRFARSWSVAHKPSAPRALPGRPDEGSSRSVRPPRIWTDTHEVPVADVEDDLRSRGAEVLRGS